MTQETMTITDMLKLGYKLALGSTALFLTLMAIAIGINELVNRFYPKK